MTLREMARLLRCSGCEVFPADDVAVDDTPVTMITEDSRRATPGAVFIAAPGVRVDGHQFAAAAVKAGAIAIVGDQAGITELEGVPYLTVEHPRRAGGLLAHALAGDPSKALKVIAFTGTNGKSSSVLITKCVIDTNGGSAAAFGTLGYTIGGETIPAPHTTPFGEDLADMFKRARAAGHTHVVMEASSHSLEQERVAGIDFDVGVLTNVTQDHLDYHKDMKSYREAKLKLFERISGPDRFTVVNWDDPSAPVFAEASRVPCYRCSCTAAKDVECFADNIRVQVGATTFSAHTPWGKTEIAMNLVGHHNVSNALGVVAVCGGLGIPLDVIANAIASVQSVPGRFESVNAGQNFQVIVDYAHTDDGLRNVLQAARAICRGKVIVVFGCGGDRDKTKRPKMGEIAVRLADFAIVTSDNPRTENPERILLDIEVGVQRTGKRKNDDYVLILNRAEAIRHALGLAKPGDLVLIAGKGHEDYQILGTEKIHFDDREVAAEVLAERVKGGN